MPSAWTPAPAVAQSIVGVRLTRSPCLRHGRPLPRLVRVRPARRLPPRSSGLPRGNRASLGLRSRRRAGPRKIPACARSLSASSRSAAGPCTSLGKFAAVACAPLLLPYRVIGGAAPPASLRSSCLAISLRLAVRSPPFVRLGPPPPCALLASLSLRCGVSASAPLSSAPSRPQPCKPVGVGCRSVGAPPRPPSLPRSLSPCCRPAHFARSVRLRSLPRPWPVLLGPLLFWLGSVLPRAIAAWPALRRGRWVYCCLVVCCWRGWLLRPCSDTAPTMLQKVK